MKFTVTTVAMTDDDTNTDKFYRTFVAENGLELRQNGRIGTTGAVAGFLKHNNDKAAELSADTQIRAKAKKGYKGHLVATFDYPDAKVPTTKDRAKHVFQAFQATTLPGARPSEIVDGPTAPRVVTQQVTVDGLDALLETVMAGINASIMSPADGSRIYMEVSEQIKQQQEKFSQILAYHETLEDLVMA